jgi:glycosyltransferase involved in cell wall biosynthesis
MEEGVALWGDRNIGMIFYADTRFDPASLDFLRRMDVVICGSRYNKTLLREAGLDNVRMVWQGIDPTETGQPPRRRRWGDRFVVFSGGKLEFRKGQDIVLAAFRRFQQNHPDALLVTAWHSFWPGLALTMAESTLLSVFPEIRDNTVQVAQWAADNGVSPENFVDLGLVSRPLIAEIMAECDVAVFPNRCEGGTNLVAMEALACGVSTVVAANSGQLDLLEWGDICWPLTRQTPLADPDGRRRGWAASDPEELVEAMETIYRNGADVERRRVRAREILHGGFTWRQFAEKFVPACEGEAEPQDATLWLRLGAPTPHLAA